MDELMCRRIKTCYRQLLSFRHVVFVSACGHIVWWGECFIV